MGKDPVVIIGMHRSGTSMITELLEKFGLFVGREKDINNEAIFFYNLNEWIFEQANASWDNPYNMNCMDADFKRWVVEFTAKQFTHPRRIKFLGLRKFLRYRNIVDLDIPWGWKEPRNTYTAEIWKELFPSMKVINVYRNPIDVAQSLRTREIMMRKQYRPNLRGMARKANLRGKLFFSSSLRAFDLEEGIKLWGEYVSKSISLANVFGPNMIHVKYEDFLDKPAEKMQEIVRFISLETKDVKIQNIVCDVKADRKYAFLKNEHLATVYKNIQNDPLLASLGYDNLL